MPSPTSSTSLEASNPQRQRDTITTPTFLEEALARDERLEQAARTEVGRMEDVGDILRGAPLLTAIVMECLRLYPPAWLITRIAAENQTLDGLNIAETATMNIILYSIHRDSDEWDLPNEFEPQRWLEPSGYRKGAYLPFGGGQRVCIGSHLGMVEIVAMLAAVLRSYRLDVIELDDTPQVRTLLVPTRFTARLMSIS